jgi:hypothetical protein
MAGHLLVKNSENKHVVQLVKDFLNRFNPDTMLDFLRYNCDGDLIKHEKINKEYLCYQKLTDRNEFKDKLVLSIYPLDMNSFGETTENAIAEIHISVDDELKIYQVY